MWIKHVSEAEASGVVAKIYKGTMRSWGGVDNIIKAHSLNTAALRALMTFYNGLMHGNCGLTLAQHCGLFCLVQPDGGRPGGKAGGFLGNRRDVKYMS